MLRETLLTGAALAGVICLLAAVTAIGFHVRPLIFRSGSMEPAISTGSLALARTVPAAELQLGDVVSVTNAAGTRITHRIVSMNTSGPIPTLLLRGDANTVADAETYPVTEADRVFFSVPGLGYVVAWLSHPYAVFTGGVLLGALVTLGFLARHDGPKPPGRSGRATGPVAPPRPRDDRPATHQARGTAWLVAVPVAALTLSMLNPAAIGTEAAFTDAGTATTGAFTTITYFTCDSAIVANGPRVYYKLNETGTTTTAADSSGQGRNGTYSAAGVAKGVASPCIRDGGTAVTFNGSSGYVSWGPGISIPATYSTSVWIRTNTGRGGFIAGWGAAQTGSSVTVDRVIYMRNDGKLTFGINNAAKATITSTNAYNDGAWHHVMATVGTGGMRLYVDGVQVASATTRATGIYTGNLRIGYDNLTNWNSRPTSDYFAGSVDEVAIFNATLTATDAQEHYLAGT